MATTVDHERRKRELADAAIEVVMTRGLDGLTIRAVAAAAGWSVGALSYYFPNKDALLQAAHHRVIERIFARVREVESTMAPLDRLRVTLLAALPVDEERTAELVVWWAFVARALARADFGEQQRTGHRFWIAEIERHLTDARDAGQIPPETDVAGEARELSLLVDGLALQGSLFNKAEMRGTRQVELVDARLARLSEPSPTSYAGRG